MIKSNKIFSKIKDVRLLKMFPQIAAIVALMLSLLLLYLSQTSEPGKKIAVIDFEYLRQKSIYDIAQNDAITEQQREVAVDKLLYTDFPKLKTRIVQIANQTGYIIFDKSLVFGGAEDITNQASELLTDIIKENDQIQ